jgi:hypothetical protein
MYLNPQSCLITEDRLYVKLSLTSQHKIYLNPKSCLITEDRLYVKLQSYLAI